MWKHFRRGKCLLRVPRMQSPLYRIANTIAVGRKTRQDYPDELLVRIAEFHGVPYLRQLDFPVVTDVATQIGEKFARSNNLVPLYVEGVERFVVTDPEEYQLLDAIVDVLNRLPEFAVADELSIRMKLNEYFGVIKSNSSMDFTPMPGTYG